jgi:imidazole glycerol-phosphate synthase subunit HisH
MRINPAVLDLGIGNTLALVSMAANQGFNLDVTLGSNELANRSHLIIPGVGNFSRAATALERDGVAEAILNFAASGKPLLGVCLGMQLLGRHSDESGDRGLSLIDFAVEELPNSSGTKVPHIGWNFVRTAATSKLLGDEVGESTKFYFNHGFAILGGETSWAKGVTESGVAFTSVVEKDNVMGVQFHPEKSHVFGMALLKRFLSL